MEGSFKPLDVKYVFVSNGGVFSHRTTFHSPEELLLSVPTVHVLRIPCPCWAFPGELLRLVAAVHFLQSLTLRPCVRRSLCKTWLLRAEAQRKPCIVGAEDSVVICLHLWPQFIPFKMDTNFPRKSFVEIGLLLKLCFLSTCWFSGICEMLLESQRIPWVCCQLTEVF